MSNPEDNLRRIFEALQRVFGGSGGAEDNLRRVFEDVRRVFEGSGSGDVDPVIGRILNAIEYVVEGGVGVVMLNAIESPSTSSTSLSCWRNNWVELLWGDVGALMLYCIDIMFGMSGNVSEDHIKLRCRGLLAYLITVLDCNETPRWIIYLYCFAVVVVSLLVAPTYQLILRTRVEE